MNGLRRLPIFLAALGLVLAACTAADEDGAETEADVDTVSPEPETEPATETEIGITETEEDTTTAAGDDGQDILALLEDNPQLSTLVDTIRTAGVEEALERTAPITVFAPNDRAFQQMSTSDLQAFLANPNQIGDVLQSHVVEGAITTADLSDGETLTTLQGDTLQVSVDGDTLRVNGAEVVQGDLRAGRSVIHIIDTVIQP